MNFVFFLSSLMCKYLRKWIWKKIVKNVKLLGLRYLEWVLYEKVCNWYDK